MFYAISGCVIGIVTSMLIVQLGGISQRRSSIIPSSSDVVIMLGGIVGGLIGFGVGATRLLNGNYIPYM